MLEHIEEFNRYILIVGFKKVNIKDTEAFLGEMQRKKPSNVEIQFFDVRFVASWQHLYFATLNALTAFKNKREISKNIALETMLYASAQRQIRKAMSLLGITPKTSEIAVLIIGENPETVKSALQAISANINAQRDDTVLELSEEKKKIIKKTFGISELELSTVMKKDNLGDALTNLVIERMALLATQR